MVHDISGWFVPLMVLGAITVLILFWCLVEDLADQRREFHRGLQWDDYYRQCKEYEKGATSHRPQRPTCHDPWLMDRK